MQNVNLQKKLILLAASFAVVGTLLYFNFHVGLMPILLGGAVACAATLLMHYSSKR